MKKLKHRIKNPILYKFSLFCITLIMCGQHGYSQNATSGFLIKYKWDEVGDESGFSIEGEDELLTTVSGLPDVAVGNNAMLELIYGCETPGGYDYDSYADCIPFFQSFLDNPANAWIEGINNLINQGQLPSPLPYNRLGKTLQGESYPIQIQIERTGDGEINGDKPTYEVVVRAEYANPSDNGDVFTNILSSQKTWDPNAMGDTYFDIISLDIPSGAVLGGITIGVQAWGIQGFISHPFYAEGTIKEQVPILATSVLPVIPEIVLEDPPGDGSFTTYTNSATACREVTNSSVSSFNNSSSLSTQVGFEGDIGFVQTVPIEVTVDIGAGIEVTNTQTSTSTYEKCVNFTSSFTTSSLPPQSDGSPEIFIGYGGSRHFGKFRQVKVNAAGFVEIDEDGITYYDEPDLNPSLLRKPQIQAEINNLIQMENNPSLAEEIRTNAQNQRQIWEKVLIQDNAARATAMQIDSKTVTGQNTQTVSEALTVTQSESFDISFEMSTSVALDLNVNIAGNGIGASTEFTMTESKSQGSTNGQVDSKIVEFTLFDDEFNDKLIVDVYQHPLYGTPIFRLDESQSFTSCPYEGGARRDVPFVNTFQQGNPGSASKNMTVSQDNINATITLVLNICNNSETNELRNYTLDLQNNDQGAQVIANNTSLNNANNSVNILNVPAGGCKTPLLTIRRNPALAQPGDPNYSILNDIYENLTFRLYPECGESSEADITVVNARFGDRDLDGIPTVVDLCPDTRDSALDFKDRGDASGNTSDYVQFGPGGDLNNLTTGDFAFEAWVNPASGDYKTIVSKGNGGTSETDYIFEINANTDPFFSQPGKLGLFLTDGTNGEWQFGNTSIPQNTWTHVAVSVDNSGVTPVATFFVNGIADGERTYSLTSLFNSGSVPGFIGRQGSGCQCNHFDGIMDDIAIWKRQLTAAEVLATMAAPIPTPQAGLVNFYDLNDEAACGIGGTNLILGDSGSGGQALAIMYNFDRESNNSTLCRSNWTSGRNLDSDGDGIGDSCDTYEVPGACPPSLDLTSTQSSNAVYSSGGYISSDQTINSPAQVDYDATTEITLLENFEVKAGAIFHAFIDGCANALREIQEFAK